VDVTAGAAVRGQWGEASGLTGRVRRVQLTNIARMVELDVQLHRTSLPQN
jgi:hypothetical protein